MRLAAILFVLLATACNKATADDGSSVQGLVTSFVWPTTTLRVCFDGPTEAPQLGDLRPYEQAIAAAARRNYRPESTGIHFTSFGDCDRVPADVRIVWITDAQYDLFGVSSNVGTIDGRRYPQYGGDEVAQLFKNIDRPTIALWTQAFADTQTKLSSNHATAVDAAVWTALHELGHVAGLFHEHAAVDSTCHPSVESASQRFEIFPDIGDRTYLPTSRYDPYSVMSYCFGGQALGLTSLFPPDPSIDARRLPPPDRIGLSRHDREALRALYGTRNEW